MTSGAELIAMERKRQVEGEGFTPEHDDRHRFGELARLASYYLVETRSLSLHDGMSLYPQVFFPEDWSRDWMKRQGDPAPTLRDLVKAGALIAAEIDRRMRAGESFNGPE